MKFVKLICENSVYGKANKFEQREYRKEKGFS